MRINGNVCGIYLIFTSRLLLLGDLKKKKKKHCLINTSIAYEFTVNCALPPCKRNHNFLIIKIYLYFSFYFRRKLKYLTTHL